MPMTGTCGACCTRGPYHEDLVIGNCQARPLAASSTGTYSQQGQG